jgi:hypothetical protein
MMRRSMRVLRVIFTIAIASLGGEWPTSDGRQLGTGDRHPVVSSPQGLITAIAVQARPTARMFAKPRSSPSTAHATDLQRQLVIEPGSACTVDLEPSEREPSSAAESPTAPRAPPVITST